MTLNDIRKRSGLLIFVIGIAMLGFILTDLMSGGTSLFQKGQNLLLRVNDTELSFTNFEKELEQNINIKFISSFGTVNITEEQRQKERDLFFEQKTEDMLLSEKFNQSGIKVGDRETWDLISGELTGNQASLFGYFFREQTESGEWNQYNPELIRDWIEMGRDNPQWPRYIFFKNNEIRERQISKYYNAIKNGLYATVQDARSYYKDQTKTVSGKYVYIPSNNFNKEDAPSEKEIKSYYQNNKNLFKNIPNRSITYFVFDLVASEDDKELLMEAMNDLIKDRPIFNKRLNKEEIDLGFLNTQDLKNFVTQNGDNTYNLDLISLAEFKKIKKERRVDNNLVYPYFEKNACKMARVVNVDSDSVSIVYLERELYASDQTLNDIYSNVFDFINTNKEILDAKEISKQINIRPRTVILEKMDQSVPGLGAAREIVRWAFSEETNLYETKFFDLQDKYIVAFVSKISEGEYKTIEELRDDIGLILQKKNTSSNVSDHIIKSNYNKIQDVANHYNVSTNSIQQLRSNSDVFGETGYNPGAVGAFFGTDVNVISEPFTNEEGVFVFLKEVDGDVSYPNSMDSYKNIIERTYQSDVDKLLIDILKEKSSIIDNRFNFY
ncbi:MAG: hypothetical protein CMD27_01315 [Flavobacteriales bacterium]|nr:hypothetical protein [Flavobacteriales bacterium]|tara:strand:+ start:999 stop:2828 length:1830 start_codon:yes stop_codon:yes gene_type:complete